MRITLALLSVSAVLPAADLFTLVRSNDLAGLRAALNQGADANARDRRGARLLMHAAAFGSLDAMKLLLDAGADVNAKNSFDATALMWGAGDPAKVRLLVERGAEVSVRSKQGRTPLSLAATHSGNVGAVRLLLEQGAAADGVALLAAAASDDMDIMRVLVEKGANVNSAERDGGTPLLYAAGSRNLAAVKLLLAKGANVNAANTDGGTVKNGKLALVKLTPLMMAASYGSPELVRTLLDAGAEVNASDIRGMTPLMMAVASETQDPAVARLLLERGAEINAKSEAGETALDWARKYNSAPVIAVLEKAGAKTAATALAIPAATGTSNLRTAVENSTRLIQRSAATFFKEGGCAACHHTNMSAMVVNAVRSRGLAVDETAAAEAQKTVKGMWTPMQELLLQMMDLGGTTDMTAFALLGLGAEHYRADATTDAMVYYLAGRQRANGQWAFPVYAGLSRSPMEEGDIARTAMAIRSLQYFTLPARKVEFDQRIAKAREWLLAAAPKTTDDHAMRFLGLYWASAEPVELRRAAKALLAQQRPDGGWAQTARLASDAYGTGEALWALYETGLLKVSDSAYRRGMQFLLRTQHEDGSLYVRSRAPKFQPYFESGFPFGHDQWISASATAWATMALAPAVPVQSAHREFTGRGASTPRVTPH